MYRRYVAVLLGWCGLVLGCGLFAGLRTDPLVGDLTRIGGYSENEFGWNGIEERFTPPLAESGRLDRGYPIVVIGDSFSARTTPDRQTQYGSFWTDFLVAGSGLRVGVFDVTKISLEQVLASPAYRADPPRLLILELSERTLKERLTGGGDCPEVQRWIAPRLEVKAERVTPAGRRREHRPRSVESVVDQLADHVRKTILRFSFGDQVTDARQLKLTRADLFSSRRPTELLIFAEDLQKARWTAADWAAMRCRLLRYQNEVVANGATSFLFLLAPDKSSAYAPWLPLGPWQVEAAPRLANPPGLKMPRIDLALRAGIAAGLRDVYLPDDTHWSTTGARIVARTLLDYLQPEPAEDVGTDVAASR
jgi:SGNH hydrolase-like domain, acetyltransferase AlgX